MEIMEMEFIRKTSIIVILSILITTITYLYKDSVVRYETEFSNFDNCFFLKCIFARDSSGSEQINIGFTAPFNKIFAEKPINFKGEIATPPVIYMARNEYESTQMVIFPTDDLSNVSVSMSNLKHENNNAFISIDNIQINVIGYVNLLQTEVKTSRKGWHPDPLLPNQKLVLQKDVPQPLLITIRSTKETMPGEYRGNIIIDIGDERVKNIQLTVIVWNFTLPETSKFKTASFPSWNRVNEVWPTRLGYKSLTHEMRKELFQKLADIGFRNRLPPVGFLANGLDSYNSEMTGKTAITYPTHDENESGKMIFNKIRTDEMLDYMIAKGANHFFIAFTSDIYKFSDTKEARERTLITYLKDYTAHLRNRDLLKMAYVYNIDEPWGDAVDNAKKTYQLIKQEIGDDVRIMQNTNQNNNTIIGQLLDHYDALDINLGFYDINELEAYRNKYPDKFNDLWWNVNLWPRTRPNLFVEFPLVDARIIGLLSYKYQIQGFEYWDYLFFGKVDNYHPIKETDLRLDWNIKRSLDGALIYPGEKYTVYSSLRFENFRDGMEDQEYLFLLQSYSPDHELLSVPFIQNIFKYSENQKDIMDFRNKIGNILHATISK